MKTSKKMLLSGMVVLGAAALVGAGTFAGFNAQAKNDNNVVAAGTLVLSNTKQGSPTACLSTGGGSTDTNVNDGCDQLLNLTVTKPGESGSSNLTIKNDGTIDASTLKVFSAACTNGDAAAETYHGTGLPCSKVQLSIQEYSDAAYSVPSACVYGGATGSTCDFSDATKTLAAFQTTYGSSASGLALGNVAAGVSKYFKVAVKLPSSADNTFQGRAATFDLTWTAAQ